MGWYLYSVPSFIVGLAAGFQGIAERNPAGLLLRTKWSFLYLLSRGLVPVLVFVGLYYSDLIEVKRPILVIVYSAVCGVGAEVILRSKISITAGGKPGTINDESSRGLFDLLKFYQNYFLTQMGKQLPGKRLAVVNRYLPKMSFPSLCDRVLTHLPALSEEQERTRIYDGLTIYRQKYTEEMKDPKGQDLELKYRTLLAFLIYHSEGGKETLKALLSKQEPN